MGCTNRQPILRRIASLAIGLLAAPALAIAAQGPDVAAWLKQNTDLPRTQVVIAGPDVVYGFEAVTPRLATGEVIGLVRTEAMAPTWAASHNFRSWDAHVLVDCIGERMRFIRSATYSDANRHGTPTLHDESDAWITPKPDEAAAKLVAAACDPGFQWPLRPTATAPAPAPAATLQSAALAAPPAPSVTTPKLQSAALAALPVPPATTPKLPSAALAAPPALSAVMPKLQSGALIAPPAPSSTTPAAPASPTAHAEFAVQLAYGPYRAGADRALAKAQRLLGATPDTLVASTLRSQVGDARRYTAVLDGFSSAEAATQACATLAKAGQHCFLRRSAALLQAKQGAPSPAATLERAKAIAPKTPQKTERTAAAQKPAQSVRHAELASAAAVTPPAHAAGRAGAPGCAKPQSGGACVAARRPQGLEARA